ALAGPRGGEFAGSNEVVDVGKNLFEAVIDRVDIDRYGNAVVARNGGGARHGGRVVAVDVKHAPAHDHLLGDLAGTNLEAVVTPPENGALAGRPIDHDVGGLVGAVGADLDMVEIDAGAPQAFYLDPAALIVADGPDVLGAQAKARTGHHGARHLA